MSESVRLFAALMFVGAAAMLGCERETTTGTDPATQPTAGDRVAGAIESTGDALDRGAERLGSVVGEAVDEAADRTRQAGERITEEARDLAANFADDIHNLLGDVTEAAMTPRSLDDLVERLSQGDRDRIGQVDPDAFPELDSQVAQFRDRWQAKYGRQFQLEDERAVFSFVTIEGDPNHSERATVIFPPRAGMSELRVPVVREAGSWRIDVPDQLTAEQIAQNLISGLRPINAGNPPLPDDVTEGYRSSAQGTMAALLGEQRTQ